jgi:hypothetical protein
VQIPVKGSSLTINLINIGSTGNITGAIGNVLMWGDYRDLDDIKVMNFNIGATSPVVNGTVVLTQGGGPPASGISGEALGIPGWICSFESNQNPNTTPSETFLIPLPVWRGPVSGSYGQDTDALAADATIIDLTFATQGNVVAGTPYEFGLIANLPSAIGSSVDVNYNSPPTQLAFVFKTGATLGNTTVFLTGLNSLQEIKYAASYIIRTTT